MDKIFPYQKYDLALIIPNYLVSAFNVILVKNYYQNSVPDSLIEAAQLDGASELKIFFKVMLPLAVPTVATISLFTGICYWNDWTNGLYYISNEKLYSIQQLLMKIMNNIQAMRSSSNAADRNRCDRLAGNIYPNGHGSDRNSSDYADLSFCTEISGKGCCCRSRKGLIS